MIETLHRAVRHKKVLILGFGREGRSTLRLLRKAGGYASLGVADCAPLSKEELPDAVLHQGKDYQACLSQYDVIIKSPGVVLEHPTPEIVGKVTSQVELFLNRYRDRVIGITGTKGKSTTTTLLYHVLSQSVTDCVLAGNIGIPVFDIAEQMGEKTWAVCELSCHQMEYTRVSPHIALFLNLYEEHLDHYGSMERYAEAKYQIYLHQKAEDVLICRADCLPETHPGRVISFAREGEGEAEICYAHRWVDWQGTRMEIPVDEISLFGVHNVANIATAYAAASLVGVSRGAFLSALKTYQALPHRLQPIGEAEGVRYVDDSISTICESAIQAMRNLPEIGSILLGGMDRGIDYTPLEEALCTAPVDHVILMYDTGKRIFQELSEKFPAALKNREIHVVEDLADAVALAKKVTPKGKRCLLSPAAASYGFFKNFEERGEVFQKLALGDDPSEN